MNLLNKVTDQVYIDLFTLDDNSLKLILENCHNVRKLILRACEMHITPSFSSKLNINYRIEELNLFGTCDVKDGAYMNEAKLNIFVSALANTNMRTNLSLVKV